MFQKGQRVITPFGVGTIASVHETACVVELIADGRKRIGTFVREKLQVCSITEVSEPIALPTLQPEKTKIGELSYFEEPTPTPLTPRKKRGSTKRSA